MRIFVIFLLGIHMASAAIHTLQYFYTATSGIPNFPEFISLGMVDGQQTDYYDSNIKRAIPKVQWMRTAEDLEYWNRETEMCTGSEVVFKSAIDIIKPRFNQSGGVHSVQHLYGCELYDDGSKRGYAQFGYDGEDFLILDKNTRTWTAAVPQATITKVKWDSTGAEANVYSNYLDNICIEWLNKYVDYGKNILMRKVSPQVSLLQKTPSSPVTCHATGFYPSGVKISWQKNGQDHDEDVDLGELLSNEDGTFQRMSTLNVGPDEWKNNKFSCVVEHQDKTIRKTEDDIITNFDSVPIGIIVGAIAAVVLVIVIGVVGYLVYQRKKGFKPVSASDDGSNSSART